MSLLGPLSLEALEGLGPELGGPRLVAGRTLSSAGMKRLVMQSRGLLPTAKVLEELLASGGLTWTVERGAIVLDRAPARGARTP